MTVVKKNEILKSIGEKIQQARKDKGYTQEYVSEKIEKSIDTYRGIENGRSIGSLNTLINICNILEITLDYVFVDLLDKKNEILDNKLYNDLQNLKLEQKEEINVLIEYMKKKNKLNRE